MKVLKGCAGWCFFLSVRHKLESSGKREPQLCNLLHLIGRQMYGVSSLKFDMGGPSPLSSATTGKVALCCITKRAEEAMENKQGSNIPPQSLLPGSCLENLPWLPRELYDEMNSFLPKLILVVVLYYNNRKAS